MPYLTLSDIAKADDVRTEDVEVPEWGGTISVRGMTAQERLNLASAAADQEGSNLTLIAHHALLNGLVKPKITKENLEMFMGKSASALERIVEVHNRLSGIGEEAVLEERGNS